MKQYHCIKLHFNAPLHIGRGIEESYDKAESQLHSDTLSAAIASARVQLFGDKNLKEFLEKLRISSAFPFYKDHYFLPKPMLKLDLRINGQDEFKQGKVLKKLQFIEKPLFEKILKAEKINAYPGQFSKNNRFLWDKEPAIDELFSSDVQQRVMVPRLGNADSLPYNIERYYFNEDCGLFFMLDTSDEQLFRETEVALKLLEDSGLGTDRSVGNGFFKTEITRIEFNLPENPEYVMNLSLFCPEKEEVDAITRGDTAYLMTKRGGFIAGAAKENHRHLRKKSVYMFTEGSVFNGNKLKGKVLNLRPEWNDDALHPVYRSGVPFFLPLIKAVSK